MNAIQTDRLVKRYGARTAVDGLTLSIPEGQLTALLGPNGAGKTTAIRMLCALTPPTSGKAAVMGHDVRREADAVRACINVSPQETAVAPKLTVRENLVLMARLYGADRPAAERRAEGLLAHFGLVDRAEDRARQLSGGQQRRLSIAMALISDPQVLFLDEPTLGLDVRARRDLWTHIRALKGRKTVVLTTYYLEEAEALADCIVIMNRGKLQAMGRVEDILSQTGLPNLEEAFLQLTEEVES